MDTAQKNVTEISQFARARGKSIGAGRGPLDECREISALRLGEALSESLVLMTEQLLKLAEKATGMEIYRLYMEAAELARDRTEAVSEAFRQHYLWRFNRESRREGKPLVDSPHDELRLLEPDDLEASLAAGTLANAIFNSCSEELFGLDKRVGLLINDPDLNRGDNPLGPEVIGNAVMEALDDQGLSIKVRLLLVSQLSRHLPERVREIYRELNHKLVARNVLPTIRAGLRRHAPSEPSAPARPDGPAAAGSEDLFGVLLHLLSGNVAAAGPSPPMAGSAQPDRTSVAGPALATPPGALIQALNQLQHGRAEGMAGLDAAAPGNGQVNVLRNLRGSGMAGMMNPLDGMTLDIVAMVFDYIFGDARIPDAIKALLGRLQIPMLKVAMLDKSFFSHKNHPARRLLDGLAEAAIGWDPGEGHEGGLYRKVEDLVAGILEHFEDNLEIFETSLAELQAWLDTEKRAADRLTARSALAVKSREQADLARQVGRDEVESSLVGHPVPAVIRTFLDEHWTDLLADLYLKVGSDSETWKGALATMNDLIWSVAPKADTDARRHLISKLPSLLKRLDEGVKYLGLSETARNAFFSTLVKCHSSAVKADVLTEEEPLPCPIGPMLEDDVPVLEVMADFEPVEPVTEEADAPAFAEVLDDGAEPDAGMLAFEELVGLRRGSWIAYRLEDGAEVRAKLSWISPLKGVYLFTNRQGERAMSINAEGLAAKLHSGEVRILDAAPLMDRAVDSMMEQLQRNAA
ncbi:MAG: DUF1631 domain-containing protein [Gallionellaceae bacterium]|nr:DUF1631 domain-containing protein [Gallionellaceae bacterium]